MIVSRGDVLTYCSIERASIRRTLALLLAIVVSCGLTGCGGSSSSSPPEPPVDPVDVSLSAIGNSITEGTTEEVTLNIQLSETVERLITAQLTFTGTAQLNVDYEVTASQVSIAAGSRSASVRITPLVDWLEENNETVTISLGTLTGAANAVSPTSVSLVVNDDATQLPLDKTQPPGTFLWISPSIQLGYTTVTLEGSTWNLGKVGLENLEYSLSYREGRDVGYEAIDIREPVLPSLRSGGFYELTHEIDLEDLEPNKSYTYRLSVRGVDTNGRSYSRTRTIGFKLDEMRRIISRCESPNRPGTPGVADPLVEHQWNLRNTGQNAFADGSGISGEDLGMTQVLDSGTPTGADINVAVVDTGLEICHPDLESNVDPNRSFNFIDPGTDDESWFVDLDPFLFENEGDHGTSVAGLIASEASNGVGGRGVSPNAKLRGYNVLTTQCCFDEALGGSTVSPDSSDVDVFNMSFGTFGSFQYLAQDNDFQIHKTGTENLRNGKGAIFVKSAGNTFNLCIGIRHLANSRLGCISSITDNRNGVPYVLTVGAFSADGERSSYSSIGSNLWISAPSGEFGRSEPAMITTDQYGFEKGYDYLRFNGVTNDPSINPHGDYISTFNGTSAAAPNIAGSVALILDAFPELSWREVKHVFAKTARKIHGEIEPYEVVFGDEKVTLQHAWITNGAGYNFHNWYGFGAAAIDAALEYLEQYTLGSLGEFVESGWFAIANVQAIPDHNGGGVTQPINVTVDSNNRNVEAVQVEVDISHPYPAELTIQLISPDGTESILNPIYNNTLIGDDYIALRILSNAFYGESPSGRWQLKVIDIGEGDVGQLNSWRIRVFHGQHND